MLCLQLSVLKNKCRHGCADVSLAYCLSLNLLGSTTASDNFTCTSTLTTKATVL